MIFNQYVFYVPFIVILATLVFLWIKYFVKKRKHEDRDLPLWMQKIAFEFTHPHPNYIFLISVVLCVPMFLIMIAVLVYVFLMPKVEIIDHTSGNHFEEGWAPFYYNGKVCGPGDRVLYNKTNDTLCIITIDTKDGVIIKEELFSKVLPNQSVMIPQRIKQYFCYNPWAINNEHLMMTGYPEGEDAKPSTEEKTVLSLITMKEYREKFEGYNSQTNEIINSVTNTLQEFDQESDQ